VSVLSRLAAPAVRPFAILVAVFAMFAVLAAIDRSGRSFVSVATGFSVMQLFATLSLVTLGLALTMMIREFDISVAGMFGLAGVVAVMTGVESPWLGLAAAVAVGLFAGLAQGLIIVWLRLSSVAVTLGGLLTFLGIAFVLTRNTSISYGNMDVALALNHALFGLFSVRTLVAVAVIVCVAALMAFTRVGRDVIATGSDRHASATAGVNTDRILIGAFMASGALTALGAALLSYSLAAATPGGLVADLLVPATAAAIIGGVSLGGGRGHPLGIAAGVLVLCLLRSGLTAMEAPPHVHQIVIGAVLLLVAILDGPALARRVTEWRLGWREMRAGQDAAARGAAS
jgi:ribose/xylose/arabinose/galactoside ABC-type transport system permease subunit